MKKATTLRDIYEAFSLKPLQVDEIPGYFVNTSEARGDERPTECVEMLLRENIHSHQHILFAGYKGCGKSTELNRLQANLQDDFYILNFSVQDELDPVSLHYIELFIVTMERLFGFVKEKGLTISKEYLESIQKWLASEEITEIRDKYVATDLEVGAKASVGIPALFDFFSRLKASAKASKSLKVVLTRNIEPKLSELTFHCNSLIQEIQSQLIQTEKIGLLIIIEDLDKIPLERSKDLFYNYSHQLTQLNIHIIFTFPIALVYNMLYTTIARYFSGGSYELPMIPINKKEGGKDERGREIMRQIVFRRMEKRLWEKPELLEKMIGNSGGCLRDLFLLIKEAAVNARIFEREKITEEDYRRAYLRLKKEYDNTIADRIDNGVVKIPVKDYYDALVKLVKSEDKKPENTEIVMDLRQNLTILGYNGEGWCDVHPIVRDILIERKKLEE